MSKETCTTRQKRRVLHVKREVDHMSKETYILHTHTCAHLTYTRHTHTRYTLYTYILYTYIWCLPHEIYVIYVRIVYVYMVYSTRDIRYIRTYCIRIYGVFHLYVEYTYTSCVSRVYVGFAHVMYTNRVG